MNTSRPDNEYQLRKDLGDLFASQRLAVLATEEAGKPYANLVAFATTDDLRHVLFATGRATRKYSNLSSNSRVSMLMDNRSNEIADFGDATAVTVIGAAIEVNGVERDDLLKLFVAKHPNLTEFAASPTCALFKIQVRSYVVVSRFQNVVTLDLPE